MIMIMIKTKTNTHTHTQTKQSNKQTKTKQNKSAISRQTNAQRKINARGSFETKHFFCYLALPKEKRFDIEVKRPS